jgi:Spy/CpxP family protein refolding chaperone
MLQPLANTRGINMKFNKTTIVASAAALSLGLAACDSPEENAMEDQAEQMEDNRDAMVNDMEASGEITDEQADAMDDETDAMEESMEETADDMDTP